MQNKRNKSKILIFDFDGTIVDSKQVYYHAMNKHLSKYFSKKQVDEAIDTGLSVAETLKKLGFSSLLRWLLKRKIMKEVLKKTNEIKKCRDVDSIRELPERKILISNSYSDFVMPVLKHLRLKKEFKEIYCAEKFKDKAEFIKNYLKNNKFNKKEVFYIGDRAADVKLARKIGVKSVIITGKCAWDSRQEILKEKPDFVIEDIKDIEKIL